MMKLIVLLTFIATVITPAFSTVELTADDFEAKTTGTKAMIKFYAPWCGVSIFSTQN